MEIYRTIFDDDKFGTLEVWKFTQLCVIVISLEVYRTICDDDKFGSLEVYTMCVMPISLEFCKCTKPCPYVMMIILEVWKFGSLHVVCNGDKFRSLEVYKSMPICDDDKFGSLEVRKFTHCV